MLPPSAWALVGSIADSPTPASRTTLPTRPSRREARAAKRGGQAR